MELLSPAGSYKAFIGAVNAGCDAVYLGGEKYGARAYAENFSDDEIIKAIKVAHIYGVKVYLTVNTIIKEDEFSDVCEYIDKFYKEGLDACIVQDLGLISVFSEKFPKMECHVSTQAFATGLESVRFYKKLGAKRVVLARELSLKEIKEIKETEDIEIETFIHGAMCYSYSGECLFSSCLGGRSGNRGRCAGPCRQLYKYDSADSPSKEAYFLSMKDQCTLSILPELINAGIDSLKIEGRMKKPEYSAFVTSIYRKYIDLYLNNPAGYKVDKKDLEDLYHIYLRAEIGTGYYNRQNGKDMMTLDFPGYLGNDETLLEKINEKYLKEIIRKPITAYLSAITGESVSLTYIYNEFSASVSGDTVLLAEKKPVSKDDLKKQISKLGDTCFYLEEAYVEASDNAFLPISSINELRRLCIDALIAEINKKEEYINLSAIADIRRTKIPVNKSIVFVCSKEQGEIAADYTDKAFIGIPAELADDCNDRLSGNVVILPNIARNKDKNYLNRIISMCIDRNVAGIVVRNYEEIEYILNSKFKGFVISGSEIYAPNKKAVELLDNIFDGIVLPLELSKRELKSIYRDNSFIFAYGKIPMMQTANCVRKTNFKCTPKEGKRFSYIIDRKNASFPVYRNCDICSNTIYNSVPTCLYDELQDGFVNKDRLIIGLTDEDYNETKNILDLFFRNKGSVPKDFTKFYWKHGVI